jgi:hypothetical protein
MAGIHVYTSDPAGVAIGDVVDVTGRVAEYFGDTQLVTGPDGVIDKGVDNVIVPVDLTVAQAAAEEYEGQLVRLTDVTSFVDPYDCSADNMACADPNLWEVNGEIIVFDRCYADNDVTWDSVSSSDYVIGVMTYRFDRRRIQPRSSADLVAP